MRRVYLFVYSDLMGDRDALKALLNSTPAILDWRFDMPNCFYIVSELRANELSELIHQHYESQPCRFLISEITANRQGYLPRQTWEFINSNRGRE